jgi:hypothetical protein
MQLTYAQYKQIVDRKAAYIASLNARYILARKHGTKDQLKPRMNDYFELQVLRKVLAANHRTGLNQIITLPAFIDVQKFNHLLAVIKL